jgi:hypothetical protein
LYALVSIDFSLGILPELTLQGRCSSHEIERPANSKIWSKSDFLSTLIQPHSQNIPLLSTAKQHPGHFSAMSTEWTPPNATSRQAGSGHHDNLSMPKLYFLDIGLGANFDVRDGLKAGRVVTALSDGTDMKTLIDGVVSPDGIDVSISTGRIFWTSMGIPGKSDGSVWSAKLDGSDVKMIIQNGAVNTPKQLSIDHTASKIYFCELRLAVISNESF